MCSWEGSILWEQLAGEDPRPLHCPLPLFVDADVMTGTPAAPLDHEVNLQMEATCGGSRKARLWTRDDSRGHCTTSGSPTSGLVVQERRKHPAPTVTIRPCALGFLAHQTTNYSTSN